MPDRANSNLAFPCGEACAGFPSPAEDHLDAPLDLAALAAPGPAGFLEPCHAPWACGGPGLLVVRAGPRPRPGDTVVAEADGRRVTARVAASPGGPLLLGPGGRPLRCGEARVLGVAAWAARAHAAEPPRRAPADLSGLVRDRAGTYLFRVAGWSMRDAGVHDGDILVVDRGIRPAGGHVVVAVAAGSRTVKRLVVEEGRARLSFDNADFPPYAPPAGGEVSIFGVVTWGLRRLGVRGRP